MGFFQWIRTRIADAVFGGFADGLARIGENIEEVKHDKTLVIENELTINGNGRRRVTAKAGR